jgi:hypothetical protein
VIKKKRYSLSEQYAALRRYYPNFQTRLQKNFVLCSGSIKPTPRSISYKFKLSYRINSRPQVNILEPALKKNYNNSPIPHLYPRNELCLYYPGYEEFNSTMLVADYIIPWISLWLYHYENWHITDKWEGGGIHPPKIKV